MLLDDIVADIVGDVVADVDVICKQRQKVECIKHNPNSASIPCSYK